MKRINHLLLARNVSSTKNLLSLASPIYVSQFCRNILFLMGAIFSGHLSINMIAGVGMGMVIWKMILYFPNGVSSTTTQNISNLLGANQLDKIKSTMQQSLYLSLISGLIAVLFCFVCSHFVYLLPLEKQVTDITKAYLQFGSLGLLFSSILTVLVSYAESKNEAKIISIISIFSVSIGVLLLYVLLYKSNLGGMGCGLANTLTFLLNLVLVYSFLKYKEKKNLIEHHSFLSDFEPFNKNQILVLSKLGFPVGILLMADGALTSVSSIIMSGMDKHFLAIHQALTTVISQVYLIISAIVIAVSITVAKYFGGKKYKTMQHQLKVSIITLLLFFGFNISMVYMFSDEVFSLFLPNKALIPIAISLLPFVFISHFFDMTQIFSTALLKAIKLVTLPIMMVNLGFVALGIATTYYLLNIMHLGMLSYWLSLMTTYLSVGFFNLVIFKVKMSDSRPITKTVVKRSIIAPTQPQPQLTSEVA